MTIGDRIRRIRKKRRLTQAELAMMSGLSLSAIQGYEQGRYEPKRKSLESIAEVFKIPVDELYDMPVQHGTNLAEVGTDVPDINAGDINKFIDSLEEIFANIRESHVDDSVCGLCEYDGAYIGQSGDWCNECPGFDRDDCFKLSDKCRKRWIDTITKALPSAQPEIIRCKDCKHYIPYDWMFSEVWQSKNIADYPEDEIGCEWSEMAMKANDFCSRGEKREVTT